MESSLPDGTQSAPAAQLRLPTYSSRPAAKSALFGAAQFEEILETMSRWMGCPLGVSIYARGSSTEQPNRAVSHWAGILLRAEDLTGSFFYRDRGDCWCFHFVGDGDPELHIHRELIIGYRNHESELSIEMNSTTIQLMQL